MPTLPLLLTLSLPVHAEPLPDPASCTEELATYIEGVASKGDRESYLCLAARDDAKDALLTALGEREEGEHTRVSRAMAIHLLQRLDQPLPGEAITALEAVDQRLLRDGVYAHRGRETPAEEHAKVFEQFDWYEPFDKYTNGRLTELDRANIDLIDHPPEAVRESEAEAPSAADAIAATQEAAAPSEAAQQVDTWCGCQAAAAPAAFAWLMGLGALVRRRRV